MISFIIIGKNIEPTIRNCFDSVFQFIKKNRINFAEVIYADSDSKDQSLKIAQTYDVKIVRLQGNLNAAVGRNEGAKVSKGDILFFIDGDMELSSGCYSYFFKNEQVLIYPFLRGILINKYYTRGFEKVIYSEPYVEGVATLNFYSRNISGGLFLIERKYWEQLGGMDDRFRSHEDADFGLRMAQNGVNQRVYNKLMVAHNMVSYYNISRIKQFLISDTLFYSGVLIRKHLLNKVYWFTFIRARYSLLILIIGLFLFLINFKAGIIVSLIYLFLQLTRTIKLYKSEPYFTFILLYKLFFDFYALLGFIFFFPVNRKYKVKYIE